MLMQYRLGQPADITFTLDFHEIVTGDLLPGTRFWIRYDPLRIVPPEDDYHFGDPGRPILAHIQFHLRGPTTTLPLESRVGVYQAPQIDVDITGQGTMLHAWSEVPKDAQEVVIWFSYVDRSGITHWDSEYGDNYVFRFLTRDLAILDAVVMSDPQTPYSNFGVRVAAVPAISKITVRFRTLNDPSKSSSRSEVELQRTSETDDHGIAIWSNSTTPVPYHAVIAFDLVYIVDGRSFTNDNQGRYFIATGPPEVPVAGAAAKPANKG
jgi:hypothetical protein